MAMNHQQALLERIEIRKGKNFPWKEYHFFEDVFG